MASSVISITSMALLFWRLLFLAVSCTLVVASCGEPTGRPSEVKTSNRRALATAVSNATRSLAEDAEVLFLLKAAITSDPLNVTRYWKPIGKRQRVNPCRPWVGITCTRRRVTAINLHNQSLGGTIPAALGRLAALKTLNLSSNHFSGPIPPELTSASSLETLDLGNNNLTGSLPSSIGNLLNIQTLSFSENHLSGPFPAELASLLSLETLDLSNNNLTGALPVSFQGLKNLTVLHLQNNLLEGDLLSRVPTFSALQDLDVTNNRLNGSIPGEIGAVPLQMGLLLGGNFLNGSIPDGLGELALVKRIDLSENSFSGGVPGSIQKCISLVELNVAGNGLSGGFSVADGTLPGLAILNVSHNFLNGSLPSLSHLGNLTVFDGSFNSFSGGVASSFVSFASLQWLNVSSNRLSGEVPYFVVHENVTERSFLNNSGLCGEVLGVGCGHGGKLATTTVVYIAVGSAGGLVLVVLVVCILVTYCRGWNKGSRRSAQVSAELQLKLTPEEVLAATRGFSEASFIGEGKLSAVYRGVLPDETVVAVKRLVISSNDRGKEEKALDAELEALGHIRHRSLVKVLGYCAGAEAKALVLEYMPHGSLAGLLYSPQNAEVNRAFDWTIRFKIAVEIAEGLKYLHAESRHPVVHGDVKPSNVLFDAKMEAKVADFGVERIVAELGFSPAPSPSTPVTAAHGYTPSEVAASGVPSMKGDVYSFGIIMLEMITGRDPSRLEPGQTLPQWVRATVANSKALQNVLDPVLVPDLPFHQQKMAMVLGVALLCTRSEPQDRPHMNDVYKMLAHVRSKPNETSRRKGLMRSGRRTSSVARRSAREVLQQQQSLPHTPSLSDWTPPSQV